MDADTTKKMKATLEEELTRLQAEVEQLEREGHETLSEVSGENNYRDHMADQGTATFSREMDMTLEENVRQSLEAVRHAITRIDEGVYDVCERCGKKISDERLMAIPTATLCIKCKSDEESL